MARIAIEKHVLVRAGEPSTDFRVGRSEDGAGATELVFVSDGVRCVVLLEPHESVDLGVALIMIAGDVMRTRKAAPAPAHLPIVGDRRS